MMRLILPFFVLISGIINVNAQTRLSGEGMILDSVWNKVIYASAIPSMDQRFTCSEDLFIGKAIIEKDGSWEMNIPSLDYATLIRLHVSKKRAPAASLIIGGPDENHAFYAIDGQKELKVANPEDERLFRSYSVVDDQLNKRLSLLDNAYKNWETKDQQTATLDIKNSFRAAFAQQLLEYSDTCSFILPAIYSAYLSDFGFNRDLVFSQMGELRSRFGDHPYLLDYPYTAKPAIHIWLISLLSILLIGWLLWKWKENTTVKMMEQKVSSLSQREYEVYCLLITGISNKEIATQLSVETSTIKSHVNKIYQKLEITSRNEIRKYRQVVTQ